MSTNYHMNSIEFENEKKVIDNLSQHAATLREQVVEKLSTLPQTVNILLDSIRIRNTAFENYFNLLKDFSFSDEITSPSDLFPGIRVTNETIDFDDLNKKVDEMKQFASQIDSNTKQIEALDSSVVNSLKESLTLLKEYLLQASHMYDVEMDLLQQLDSPYDITRK